MRCHSRPASIIITAVTAANQAGLPKVKVTAITANLGGQNTEMLANVQDRQSKWDALMRKREQEFANESYDARYAAVAETTEGKSILAQMVQPTKTA